MLVMLSLDPKSPFFMHCCASSFGQQGILEIHGEGICIEWWGKLMAWMGCWHEDGAQRGCFHWLSPWNWIQSCNPRVIYSCGNHEQPCPGMGQDFCPVYRFTPDNVISSPFAKSLDPWEMLMAHHRGHFLHAKDCRLQDGALDQSQQNKTAIVCIKTMFRPCAAPGLARG